MSQDLRHRPGNNSPGGSNNVPPVGIDDRPNSSSGLSVSNMLRGSPQHHGSVTKLHASVFFSVLPRFLQKLIMRIRVFSFMAPRWKNRYLILLGSYLYKFKDDSNSGRPPKGSPVPIDSVDIRILEGPSLERDEMSVPISRLPPGYSSVFVVSSLRKKQYFAAASREQALVWVNSLREARQEAITRSMGHAPDGSYPPVWTHYDSLGRSLLSSKERVKDRMEKHQMREMELSSLGEGGQYPKGYFG